MILFVYEQTFLELYIVFEAWACESPGFFLGRFKKNV